MTQRAVAYWAIPPEQDAEFVAAMEEVLEVYERPYDPMHPVICMDGQPVQLIKEPRTPPPRHNRYGSIISMNALALRAFLCSPNRWPTLT